MGAVGGGRQCGDDYRDSVCDAGDGDNGDQGSIWVDEIHYS